MPKRKGAEVPSYPSMPTPRIIAIANTLLLDSRVL